MMCQHRFINFNKGTTLVGSVDNEGSCACVRAGGVWEISVPSSQFYSEHKTTLKKILEKKNLDNELKTFNWEPYNHPDYC